MGSSFAGLDEALGLIGLSDEDSAAQCEELLGRIHRVTDVELLAAPLDSKWRVTVAAVDCLGILSVFHGLFTSFDIDIVEGYAVKIEREAPDSVPIGKLPASLRRDPRRSPQPMKREARSCVLAYWIVRLPESFAEDDWSRFEHELHRAVELFATKDLSAARETFIEFATQAASKDRQRRLSVEETGGKPVNLNYTAADGGQPAKLVIQGADALGILFEVTNALAMLGVSIERMEIRTENQEIKDTVWISDARGRSITDPQRLADLCDSVSLVVQFTRFLARSPDPEQALEQFVQLTSDLVAQSGGASGMGNLESEQVLRTLSLVLGSSKFLWDDFLRIQTEDLLPIVGELRSFDGRVSKKVLAGELEAQIDQLSEFEEKIETLNRWKDREMFRVDLRHLTRKIAFAAFADELSDVADVTISEACHLSEAALREKYGVPQIDGRACAWGVFGLGKLGGREVGYASDVELLFIYEGQGKTSGPSSIANSDYFERLVSQFLRCVRSKRDGIFEVDLRLRPFGQSGSTASSLNGFRRYFSNDGDAMPFHRLALIKLRPIAGDIDLSDKVVGARDQFVYSDRAVDYDDLRRLRYEQLSQLVPANQISAKHSEGGLVDIEYFVQSQQIVAGCSDPSVRVTGTQRAIKQLSKIGHLPAAFAHDLLDAYGFLRRLIDALRMVRGHAKDLTLPPDDSQEFAHLARRMQYDVPEIFAVQVRATMEFVKAIWLFVKR